jgi:hypothetical protein
MKFEDLEWTDISETHGEGGIQCYLELDNGFEVSIVRHTVSYGNKNGLYEMGIFGPWGSMCDPLDWGDDVKGWLTPKDVEVELEKMIKLEDMRQLGR